MMKFKPAPPPLRFYQGLKFQIASNATVENSKNIVIMQVHEPLLDAELGLRGASNAQQVWRGTIEDGAMATLTLNHDGSFQLKEVGDILLYLWKQPCLAEWLLRGYPRFNDDL
jgi:hypothetical protein